MRQPWEDLIDAESRYIELRTAMYSSGIMGQQIRLALASFHGQATALQVLLDAPLGMVMGLLDPVFAIAVTTHAPLGLAREVLAQLDPGWLASPLKKLVDHKLDNVDPVEPYDDYRRVAELLDRLGQRSILADVVRRAERSADPDILEVADDSGSWRHDDAE
jgi:hypothetical protein